MMYHFSVEDRTGEETVEVVVETSKDETFAGLAAFQWARDTFGWIEFDGYLHLGNVDTLPGSATMIQAN